MSNTVIQLALTEKNPTILIRKKYHHYPSGAIFGSCWGTYGIPNSTLIKGDYRLKMSLARNFPI